MWVPLLRSFPGNEAHKRFSGGPKLGVLGGGQKVYVEKVYVLFRPLFEASRPSIQLGTSFSQKWFQRGPLRAGDGSPSSTEGISIP